MLAREREREKLDHGREVRDGEETPGACKREIERERSRREGGGGENQSKHQEIKKGESGRKDCAKDKDNFNRGHTEPGE